MIRRNHLKAIKIGMAVRREVAKLAWVGPCTINHYTLQNGCAAASWLFYKTLKAIGMRPRLVFGEAWCYDHWWVQCGAQYWDLTATQFEVGAPKVGVMNVRDAEPYNPEVMGKLADKEILSWISFYRPQLDRALKRLIERFDYD